MEDAFKWMINEFGLTKMTCTPILTPTKQTFEFSLPIQEDDLTKMLQKISTQMDIDCEKIELLFFEDPNNVIGVDSIQPLHVVTESNSNYAGKYCGQNKLGKYVISLNRILLNFPENLIATICHEISHIILSDINKIEEYDEYLVDLLIVFYGMGIFGANSAVNFYKNFYAWGYRKQGYLNENEWAYSLALFATIRKETNPDWITFLKKNISKGVISSISFINKTMPEDWFLNK